MKCALAVVLTFALTAAAFAQQTKNPLSSVLRDTVAARSKNTIAAIDEMPADKFDFKPTKEQMTFGELAGHIVESNYFFCANIADISEPKVEALKGTEGKDKLVAGVKASFDFCTDALAKTDDSKLGDTIKDFNGNPRPRAWAFLALGGSMADHYGMASMYLRLNGFLPPSAQKK